MTTSKATFNNNSLSQVKKVFSVLDTKSRYMLLQLFFISIISSFLDLVSLALFSPFLSILTSSAENVQNSDGLLSLINQKLASISPAALTLVFCSAVGVSCLFKLYTLKRSAQITEHIGTFLSYEAYRRVLGLDYLTWKNLNSSNYISTLTTKLFYTVTAIYSTLRGLTSLVNAIFIIFGMLYFGPVLTLSAACLIGFAYLFASRILKKNLVGNSKEINILFNKQVKFIQESFKSLKSIKLNQNLMYFELDKYKYIVADIRRRQTLNQYKGSAPKIVIESTGLIFLAVASAVIISTNGQSSFLASIGIFALGLQKLLPNFQSIFGSWSSLKARSHEIHQFVSIFEIPSPKINRNQPAPLSFSKLSLKNISYSYDTNYPPILKNFSLTITSGMKLGILGKSGSGKSTLLDIIMGLIQPDEGSSLLEYRDLKGCIFTTENISKIHPIMAHVSQRLQLKDSSILENIILDLPYDNKKVKSALYMA